MRLVQMSVLLSSMMYCNKFLSIGLFILGIMLPAIVGEIPFVISEIANGIFSHLFFVCIRKRGTCTICIDGYIKTNDKGGDLLTVRFVPSDSVS